ncbi:NAD-dependent succinate-semialdehyde dehydrogenase [Rhizobium paknamense]|uniref:Succinate-semialdehyde dehydrogenase/glutarate-semialdehyde dehydrogenase n=1 Tax=Rhizobium paknamense TaxID=1206817 RepID=A0ABU0ILH3_9HYPH|nr:NAD-dependent succinate-semialdehyde dehydrogenase [Rhizobium paknamense]MDQ0458034.1 succinate-semialdehyde dehydrogenase/glutarate-semialdehyde dehydrogenase [Rhizobium paknamense]
MAQYPDTDLLIRGSWRSGGGGAIDVVNPATGEVIGKLAKADRKDLDDALEAAAAGFAVWRKTSAFDRANVMRKAADILKSRVEEIAPVLTMEQGKPLQQARNEVNSAVEAICWFAEEATRTYGRIIPARGPDIVQNVIKEPVGPVAAFTPWNFPINQAVLKISAAVAAGCSMIVKGPEETPASCAALIKAFVDAGLPEGVLNLVYGVPSEISSYLIAHPVIRKVSFTGSTAVGKLLAEMAGKHMKRITMELGGHAPVLVFDDADLQSAVKTMARVKYYNSGQICIAPTRFMVQDKAFDNFVADFENEVSKVKVGDGLEPDVTMGPLANERRLSAMAELTEDAVKHGGKLLVGGERIGNRGNFFAPTILLETDRSAKIQIDEPFGPVALISRFKTYDEAVTEANRLPYGLAAYAFTRSAKTMNGLSEDVETGMLSINQHGLALPETPFGGVKDSGYGSEGGAEGIEAYLQPKFVTKKLI